MMQFNMYHHYTVDEHLLRCVGYLQEIERGGNDEFIVASDLMRKIRPDHRAVIYITTLFARYRQGPPRGSLDRRRQGARRLCPRSASMRRHRTGRLADRAALTMSTVAQSRDLSDARPSRISPPWCSRGADEASDHPDHGRHPWRRPGV